MAKRIIVSAPAEIAIEKAAALVVAKVWEAYKGKLWTHDRSPDPNTGKPLKLIETLAKNARPPRLNTSVARLGTVVRAGRKGGRKFVPAPAPLEDALTLPYKPRTNTDPAVLASLLAKATMTKGVLHWKRPESLKVAEPIETQMPSPQRQQYVQASTYSDEH